MVTDGESPQWPSAHMSRLQQDSEKSVFFIKTVAKINLFSNLLTKNCSNIDQIMRVVKINARRSWDS